MTSSDGHLARVDLSVYKSSVNACQIQVKLRTLKIQSDVQLAIAKFCLLIKDWIVGPRPLLMILQ